MCGIVGILDLRARCEISRALLSAMNDVQSHRGPDDGGLFIEPGAGLAHRRLAIIDLSGGHQPLFNEDESVVVVYNGEIYNFQALSDELLAAGHRFRTHCDTEVIVHAWEEWGERCVERFRGMFAFAIWDRRTETLFLARDRLGIKPLYYAPLGHGRLLFGSELKALLAHPDLQRTIDPLAIEDYFSYGYVPEPRTIFKGALKLPPGHWLKLRRGEPLREPVEYWDAPFCVHEPMSEADAVVELAERLREAVRIRMIAEVPLGAFLSGGVDSSAVVAMMAQESADPVNTCSILFRDPQYNEAEFASMVAERYHTRHHVEEVNPDDFSLLDRLAGIYDEPYADSSAIPTFRVCELARKRVTVALSGDGGDEGLAGYRRYRWHMYEESLRSLLPLGVRRPLFGTLGRLYPKADWAPRIFRAKTTFQALARDSVQGYFHTVSLLRDEIRESLYSDGFKRELGGYRGIEVMAAHAARSPTDDPLGLIQYLDTKTYLVGDILTKVDRASMANSLEVRVPLLDHKLVEWMSGLPASLKLRGSNGKRLLKKSMEPYLPSAVLYRPKMGFAVPLAQWFRGPLREEVQRVLLGRVLADTGVFNRAFIQGIVTHHQSGRRDHSVPIWSLLMLDAFLRANGEALARDMGYG